MYDDQLGILGSSIVPDDNDNKIYETTAYEQFNQRDMPPDIDDSDFAASPKDTDRKGFGKNLNSKPTA